MRRYLLLIPHKNWSPSTSSILKCDTISDSLGGFSWLPLLCIHRAQESGQHVLPRAEVSLLAPITSPDKVICVGMNYVDHCLEQNVKIPKEPIIFSKFPSSIVGPYDEIILPAMSNVNVTNVLLCFLQEGLVPTEAGSYLMVKAQDGQLCMRPWFKSKESDSLLLF